MSARRLAPVALLGLALVPAPATAEPESTSPSGPDSFGPGRAPTILQIPRPAGAEWFGLYVLGKKAGYAYNEIKADTYDGHPAIVSRAQVALSAKVGGVPTERRVAEERVYEAKDGGRLVGFRIERHGDGGEEVLVGRCSEQGIALTRIRPGLPDEERSLPPTAEVVEAADAARVVARTKRNFEGKVLDPEDLSDKGTRTRYVGEGTYLAAGVTVPVVRTETVEEKDNVPVQVTLAPDGRAIEIKFGEVMVARAEPEETAKKLEEVDLFALTRVALPRPLTREARKVPGSLTFLVTGLSEKTLFPSPRQSFKPAHDAAGLLTVKAGLPRMRARRPVAAATEELKEALKPTLAIESDHKDVKELAAKLVGDVPDAFGAAKRLVLFVNKYLAKSYGSSSDRCTDVLAAKKGDCTEHALMFTCLARAAGLPARRVDGLVYMDSGDGVPAFYWHEWAEVYVGEWVAVDPTLDQPVADATHIALGGEGTAQSAGLIGQLKIEVVDKAGVRGQAMRGGLRHESPSPVPAAP